MKTLFVGSLVVAIGICAGAMALADSPAEEPSITDLQKENRELKARVAQLERELAEAKARPPSIVWRHVPEDPKQGGSSPQFLWNPGPPSRVWGLREINGTTVYVIPCSDNDRLHSAESGQK